MKVIARQSLRFALVVLLLDLALEVIKMELPFSHNLSEWKQKLALHLLIVAAVSLLPLVGESIGFYFFRKIGISVFVISFTPAHPSLPRRSLLAICWRVAVFWAASWLSCDRLYRRPNCWPIACTA